jgi:MFS superfamily sulfate permease-like transporter
MLSGPAGLTVVMLAAIASLGSWLAVLAATVVAGVIQLLLSVARAGWRGWTQFGPFIITIVAVLFTDLLKGVSIGLGLGFFILKDNAKAGSLELHGILSGAVAGH